MEKIVLIKCTHCHTKCKSQRGLAQHLRINEKCKLIRLRVEQQGKGFLLFKGGSIVSMARSLLPSLSEYDESRTWVPTWFAQLTWMFAHINWGPTTPVFQRYGPRWSFSNALTREVIRAIESPSYQNALIFFHRNDNDVRRVENYFIRKKLYLSEDYYRNTVEGFPYFGLKYGRQCMRRILDRAQKQEDDNELQDLRETEEGAAL